MTVVSVGKGEAQLLELGPGVLERQLLGRLEMGAA